jgi:hypothetical protein
MLIMGVVVLHLLELDMCVVLPLGTLFKVFKFLCHDTHMVNVQCFLYH